MSVRFVVCLLAGFLVVTQADAQDIPRTASGKPDLSGIYNVATRTPVQRPRSLGNKLTLSDEEAQAIARKEQELATRATAASDPNREAPEVGGSGFANDIGVPELAAAAGNVGGYNWFWVDRGSGAFQIDGQWRTSIITKPESGRYPALTESGKELARARARMYRPNTGVAWWVDEGLDPGPYDDPELRPLAERCLLSFGAGGGPPAFPVLYNNLKQIVQTEDHVMIFNEMVHDARIVRLNAQHEPPEIRRWMGDSVGQWDGDTLVVDTTNFRDQTGLGGGTRELHVVERFSRIDAVTLLYAFTVEDPNVWVEAWGGEYVWPATDERIYEYACHEGNYSFGGILRGARQLEKEALGESEDE